MNQTNCTCYFFSCRVPMYATTESSQEQQQLLISTSWIQLLSPNNFLPIFLLVLSLYIFIPLASMLALALALLVSIAHLAAVVLLELKHDDSELQRQELLRKVFSNGLLLLSANVVGLYYQFMTARARQRTFERTQSCVESRVKLECEKEHQEQLLLSVIPAYIAAEVGTLLTLTSPHPYNSGKSSVESIQSVDWLTEPWRSKPSRTQSTSFIRNTHSDISGKSSSI